MVREISKATRPKAASGEDSRPGVEDLRGHRVALWLQHATDAGLAAVIFVVPLLLGGRIALGQLALVALAVWVALCWCLRQCLVSAAGWIRTPAEPLLLATLALVGLQLVELPPSVLNVLSPNVHERLPLWAADSTGSAVLGSWNTLSLTPAATREALILLSAFGLICLTVIQRVREIEDVERLLRWIAVATLAMAVFALVQHFAGNGKYYWFYQYPFSEAKQTVVGSFTNRNHLADFLAVGLGPLIWWVYDARQRPGTRTARRQQRQFARRRDGVDVKLGLRVMALGVVLFAMLMSLSRGGIMAAVVATLVCLVILRRGSLIGRRTLAAAIGIGMLLAAGLFLHGYEHLAARLDDFGSLDTLDSNQGRRKIWRANAAGIADHPLFGTGLASHSEVLPMYHANTKSSQTVEFTHAENGYIQVGLEAGVPGLMLLLTAIALCAFCCVSAMRHNLPSRAILCLAAIAAGLSASFVHSISDFVWYVPGCMTGVVVLAACAVRLWQMSRPHDVEPSRLLLAPRAGWLAGALCLVVVGGVMVQNRFMASRAEPFWHGYLRLGKTLPKLQGPDRRRTLESMAKQLTQAVGWHPDSARAHTRLAAVHLKLFDEPEDSEVDPLGVRHVREAVLASNFDSSRAMYDWLWQAFGRRSEHLQEALKHARLALKLCPLQGEGYLYLADLAFLEGPDSPGKEAYVRQAVKVRPWDGAVLFAAGQETLLAGDPDAALAYWKASFQCGVTHQQRLLSLLAPQEPARLFLEAFDPDLEALGRIERQYRRLDRPEDVRLILNRSARMSEAEARTLKGEAAAGRWLMTARAHDKLGNLAESLRCLRQAVNCSSFHYDARHALGICLMKLQEFDEAQKHLQWCHQRRPQDDKLRSQLAAAIDARLRVASRPEPSQP